MSDLADAASGSEAEDSGSAAAATHVGNQNSAKPNPLTALLLKIWNLIMLVSTIILSFYIFVLKDNSAVPFVVLGVVGLCLPPVVNMFRTMARNKQLRLELEERIREAELERIRQAKEREMQRLKQAQIMAKYEEDIHNAISNVDVAAYKVNNSME